MKHTERIEFPRRGGRGECAERGWRTTKHIRFGLQHPSRPALGSARVAPPSLRAAAKPPNPLPSVREVQ